MLLSSWSVRRGQTWSSHTGTVTRQGEDDATCQTGQKRSGDVTHVSDDVTNVLDDVTNVSDDVTQNHWTDQMWHFSFRASNKRASDSFLNIVLDILRETWKVMHKQKIIKNVFLFVIFIEKPWRRRIRRQRYSCASDYWTLLYWCLKAGSHYAAILLRPAIDSCQLENFQFYTENCDGLAHSELQRPAPSLNEPHLSNSNQQWGRNLLLTPRAIFRSKSASFPITFQHKKHFTTSCSPPSSSSSSFAQLTSKMWFLISIDTYILYATNILAYESIFKLNQNVLIISYPLHVWRSKSDVNSLLWRSCFVIDELKSKHKQLEL